MVCAPHRNMVRSLLLSPNTYASSFLQLKLFQRIVHSCSFAAAVRNDFVYTAAAIHDIKLLLKFTVHTFYIRLCIGYDAKFIVVIPFVSAVSASPIPTAAE